MANPAHSTALNVRKHLNQRGHIDSERELQFTASLLSSRNCSNQSIIWHHRQWLLRRIYGPANSTLRLQSVDSTQPGLSDALTLPPEIIKAEILIASKACEIYPRNYFAWAHRCMCMHSAMLCIDIEPKYADPEVYIELVVCEVSNLRLWIEQHISDASAVHCLVVLITSLPCLTDAVKDAPQQPTSLAGNEKLHVANKLKECSLSVSHAISLVRSYPDHESLWMYLRAVSCLDGHRTVKENDDLEKFFRETAGPWASHTGRNRIGNSVTINAYRFLSLRALKASSPRQLWSHLISVKYFTRRQGTSIWEMAWPKSTLLPTQ